MNFGFVTCVELGLSCMEAIYASGGTLALAVTLQDSQAQLKSGRVYLDRFCLVNRIPLLKVNHINDESVIREIQRREVHWLFVIGWSQIASSDVLAAPQCGALGMHPTLLPQGRGRASVPWAILKRLPFTGVTLFKLESGVDTGPIVAQRKIDLAHDCDATWLYRRVKETHAELIREVLPRLSDGSVALISQDESQSTVWPGRKPEDGRINMAGSVFDAECLVRAVTRPYPGAFVEEGGIRTIVWKARVVDKQPSSPFLSFADGYLELLEVERL